LKRGPLARPHFPSLTSFPRAARQCLPPSRDRGAFHRGRPERAPSRAPAWRAAPAGRRGQTLHVFIDVRKPRLDHRSDAFACVFRPRALPRLLQIDVSTSTALDHSNIPDRGIRGRDGCRFRSIVAFRSRQPPKVRRVRGRGSPNPRRSRPGLLPGETSPQPRSLQTPRVAVIFRHPARSGRGRRAKPPAPRTLARHGRREGRATPDLREEIRRSPTRGAFRRKAVRKRGDLSIGVSLFDRSSSAFFTAGKPREGRSRGARKLGLPIRETASRPVID
jgi:hypothetical protein